jgi:hypothetical protein
MVSSGMLRHVALEITDVSEALRSYETSVIVRATWRNIPEDVILQDNWEFTVHIINNIKLTSEISNE